MTTPGVPLVAGWRLHLAHDWQNIHKKGTFWFASIMTAVSGFGPEIRDAWRSVPDELKQVIPAHVQQAIAYAILFAMFIAVRYTSIQRTPPVERGPL